MRLMFWRRRRIPVLVLHGVLSARGALNLAAYAPLIDRAEATARVGGDWELLKSLAEGFFDSHPAQRTQD